jgi:transposase
MAKRARAGGYPTDLTDEQWAVLAPLVARPAGPGRPPTVSLRAVLNALLSLARAGCPWRLLPREFPPWTAVRYYFDKWAADGTWEAVNGRLGEQTREQRGRAAQPTAALSDSQSSKTTEAGGERGFDGGKQSTAASGTIWWIPKGICWRGWSRPRIGRSATERGGCCARLTSGGRRSEDWGRSRRQRRSGGLAMGGVGDRLGSGRARTGPQGLRGAAAAVGGGTDDCLAGPQSALEQGLRTLGGGDGDVVLSRLDQPRAAPSAP